MDLFPIYHIETSMISNESQTELSGRVLVFGDKWSIWNFREIRFLVSLPLLLLTASLFTELCMDSVFFSFILGLLIIINKY